MQTFSTCLLISKNMAAPPPSGIKYTGVRRRKWGKYVSEIRLPNSRERIWLGSYDSAEKAARAFDAAMFCLRGPTARFNFPDDPPNIDGGQGLPPEKIQAIAQLYANRYDNPRGGDADTLRSRPLVSEGTAVIDRPAVLDSGHENAGRVFESPPSNSEGTAAMDWSFLGALDAVRVFDFSYFEQPPEYSPHFGGGRNDDDDDDDGGNELYYYNLWSYGNR